METLEMLSASHPYNLTISGANILEWRFDNILLPDSNRNEPGSHGFVRYRVKPKNNLTAGSEIRNKAAIYFDFNDAVITNETLTRITIPTSLNPVPDRLISKIYPNPAHSVLHISCPGIFNYSLYNSSGALLKTVINNRDLSGLDVSSLPRGVYIIQLHTKKKSESHKFIVN